MHLYVDLTLKLGASALQILLDVNAALEDEKLNYHLNVGLNIDMITRRAELKMCQIF